MPHLALSTLGRDRPGIVERLTRVLLDHGANIEDSQMTILRGRFSVTLVISAEGDAEAMERDLQAAADELGLDALTLSEVVEVDAEPEEPSHIVTVYGADHPGIVHAVAAAIASSGSNITDLHTRLNEEGPEPLYVLLLEASVPEGREDDLQSELDAVAGSEGVEVSVRELEQDAL